MNRQQLDWGSLFSWKFLLWRLGSLGSQNSLAGDAAPTAMGGLGVYTEGGGLGEQLCWRYAAWISLSIDIPDPNCSTWIHPQIHNNLFKIILRKGFEQKKDQPIHRSKVINSFIQTTFVLHISTTNSTWIHMKPLWFCFFLRCDFNFERYPDFRRFPPRSVDGWSPGLPRRSASDPGRWNIDLAQGTVTGWNNEAGDWSDDTCKGLAYQEITICLFFFLFCFVLLLIVFWGFG